MKPLLVLVLLLALLAAGLFADRRVFRLLGEPARYTSVEVGDVVAVPEPYRGRCLHVVAVDGECRGCERIRGRRDALWLVTEQHPRNQLFPRLFVSRVLWEALDVRAIPLEMVVDANGRVQGRQNPRGREPLSCGDAGRRLDG